MDIPTGQPAIASYQRYVPKVGLEPTCAGIKSPPFDLLNYSGKVPSFRLSDASLTYVEFSNNLLVPPARFELATLRF